MPAAGVGTVITRPDVPEPVTTWVEHPHGGRDRGLRGLARAWVEVLVRPGRFFRNGVAPGDQAPGLTFAVAVALVYAGSRFLLLPATRPAFFASEAASVVVGLLVAGLIVAPAALHLTAALEVVLLAAFVRDRAGVSETVQVVAYATAPMVIAGVGVPPWLCAPPNALDPGLCAGLETAVAGLRVLCALWGTGLLVLGLAAVHGTTLLRAAVTAAPAALLVFGYLFGGVAAFETLTGVEVVTHAASASAADMARQIPAGRQPPPP